MRSVASAAKTASPVKTASAAEAGAPARQKIPFLSAGRKTAEGAGANTTLAARLGVAASSPVVAAERLWRRSGTVVNPARALTFPAGKLWRSFGTVVITAGAVASIESVAVIKRPALRVIALVVVRRVVVMPIASPVVPAPPVSSKEPETEASSEEEHRAVVPNAWIGIPAWPSNNRASIDGPGIVGRNVDDFGADRLDLDVRAFRCNGLLWRGIEMASFLCAAAHHLNGIHHALFLVVVSVPEGRSPREVFIHVAEDGGKRNECFDTRVPRQLIDCLAQSVRFKIRMRLHPPVGVDNLFGKSRGRQYLRYE